MTKLRVVFFGTPIFVIPVLKKLIDNKYDLCGVVTGNGPIEFEARKYGIKVFKPISLKKDDNIFEQLKLVNPDLCVVAAYGKIIPARYLAIPKCGFLNIHPSILPKYRGPSPVQTAILNGDSETGVSIMVIDKEVDHGLLLASKKFLISNFEFSNHDELTAELFTIGAGLLIETLPKYISGNIKLKEQNHDQATFTRMFSREDGRIKWNEPAEKIYNQIRALNPEPGTWTIWQNKIVNIPTSQVDCSQQQEEKVGTVKKIGNEIAVATEKCYLILKYIQFEGGKKMDIKSFINGHPDFLNSVLE